VTEDSATVTWTQNSWAEDSFEIERSIDGTTYSSVGTVGANITTFTNSYLSIWTNLTYSLDMLG
jgi:hypothetical protein